MTFAASVRPIAAAPCLRRRIPPSAIHGRLVRASVSPGQGLECPRSLRPLTPEGSHTCMACKYSAHNSLGPFWDTGLVYKVLQNRALPRRHSLGIWLSTRYHRCRLRLA